MPFALWLVPHQDNPFTKATQELIDDTVPKLFLPSEDIQSFPPHVTVASQIDPKNQSPQAWIDALSLGDFQPQSNELVLELSHLEAEEPFFRKLNLAVKDNTNLRQLVAVTRRAAGLEEDASYRPHLSLLYGDVPIKDVQNKVPLIEMKVGFAYGDLFACCGGALCMGGSLVFVDTEKPIREWSRAIVARRDTPWVTWRASRGLL